MRRLLVWTWKEAREHAARVRLLLVSIPVLTMLGAMIFREELQAGGSTGELTAASFIAWGLVLHALVVASGLFASDVDGGQPLPAQRLPGAMGTALGAKALLYMSTALAAFVVAALCVAGALWLMGQPERAWEVLTPWRTDQGEFTRCCALEALVFGVAVALSSVCLRNPGAAVALGAILWAIPGGAIAYACIEHRYLFPCHPQQLGVLALIVLGILAFALVLTWLLCRRRIGAPWRSAVTALALCLGLGGVGALHAAGSVRDYLDLQPHEAGWRISVACVGIDGRLAFTQVDRVHHAWPARLAGHGRSGWSSLSEARIIDLEGGTWRRVGRPGAQLTNLPVDFYMRGYAAPFLAARHVTYWEQFGLNEPAELFWLDGRSGALAHQHLEPWPDDRSRPLAQGLLRDLSTVRDSKGRRTWLWDGFLHREGSDDPVGVPAAAPALRAFPMDAIPGGWALRHRQGSMPKTAFPVVEAETGRVRSVPAREWSRAFLLSPGVVLYEERRPKVETRWTVLDLDSGRETPALGQVHQACSTLQDGRVVGTREDGDATAFVIWDPRTGAVSDLRSNAPLEGSGWARFTLPDTKGRLIAKVGDRREDRERGESTLVLVDPARVEVRPLLKPATDVDPYDVFAIDDDGSVLIVEEGRRIARLGPALGQRVVLFPRDPRTQSRAQEVK